MELRDGFLDLKLNEVISEFREKHKSEYLVVFKVTSFLHDTYNCVLGNRASPQDLYLSAFIIRLSQLFQSAVLLFERGLPSSANIVMRSIVELSFKIIQLIRNENFLHEMIMDVNSQAQKTLNYIQTNKLYELVPQDFLQQLLEDCQHKKSQHGDKKSQHGDKNIRASTLAKQNELKSEYVLYKMLCDDTHQSLSVIDEIIDVTPNGVNLIGGLRLDDFSMSLELLISMTMISFPSIIQHLLFDEHLKCQFDLLQEDFVRVFKHLN